MDASLQNMSDQREINIGHTIKVLRTAARIKQRELAQKVGMKANYLSLIEAGKRAPSLNLLRSLAKALNVPVSLLFLEAEVIQQPAGLQEHTTLLKVRQLLFEMERLRLADQSLASQPSPERAVKK